MERPAGDCPKTILKDASRFVLRMEKALELMNVKIHAVIADITGRRVQQLYRPLSLAKEIQRISCP